MRHAYGFCFLRWRKRSRAEVTAVPSLRRSKHSTGATSSTAGGAALAIRWDAAVAEAITSANGFSGFVAAVASAVASDVAGPTGGGWSAAAPSPLVAGGVSDEVPSSTAAPPPALVAANATSRYSNMKAHAWEGQQHKCSAWEGHVPGSVLAAIGELQAGAE